MSKSIKDIAEEWLDDEVRIIDRKHVDEYFELFSSYLDSKYELVEKECCPHNWAWKDCPKGCQPEVEKSKGVPCPICDIRLYTDESIPYHMESHKIFTPQPSKVEKKGCDCEEWKPPCEDCIEKGKKIYGKPQPSKCEHCDCDLQGKCIHCGEKPSLPALPEEIEILTEAKLGIQSDIHELAHAINQLIRYLRAKEKGL